jgi:hypothetical protein
LARAPATSGQSKPTRLAFSVSRSAQRGQLARHPLEHALASPLRLVLLLLQGSPLTEDAVGVSNGGCGGVGPGVGAPGTRTEDVWVAGEELLGDGVGHAGEVEAPFLLGDAGLENDLQQEIPELLAVRLGVSVLDGLEDLVGLLEDVGAQRREGLLPVPGASVRAPEAGHDGEKAFDGQRGSAHGAGF